jgi:hypothetical protein
MGEGGEVPKLFDLVEEDTAEPIPDPNFRKKHCSVCHRYLSEVRLASIAPKERDKYRHKCSKIMCEKLASCPTHFQAGHKNDPDVLEEEAQKRAEIKEKRKEEKQKKKEVLQEIKKRKVIGIF